MEPSLLEKPLDVSESVATPDIASKPFIPSYRPTPLVFVNRLLDVIDTMSGGRAGLCQRFFMFAFIGGCAALVNIAVFFIVYDLLPLPVHQDVHNVIASVLAAEISIMANFIPNDFFTFRHLAGNRSWGARCVRFHITSIGGSILTFLLQFGMSHLLHIRPIFAQAIALIIVLFYNFSVHHLFTYRHVKPAVVGE